MPRRIFRAFGRAARKAKAGLKHTVGVISGKHLSKAQMRSAFNNKSPYYVYDHKTGGYVARKGNQRWDSEGRLIKQ